MTRDVLLAKLASIDRCLARIGMADTAKLPYGVAVLFLVIAFEVRLADAQLCSQDTVCPPGTSCFTENAYCCPVSFCMPLGARTPTPCACVSPTPTARPTATSTPTSTPTPSPTPTPTVAPAGRGCAAIAPSTQFSSPWILLLGVALLLFPRFRRQSSSRRR